MYPEWLKKDIKELLSKIDQKELSTLNIDELSVTYLRCWAVIEQFSKVTHVIYEKKQHAKNINNKIIEIQSTLQKSLDSFHEREAGLKQVVDYYLDKTGALQSIPNKVILKDLTVKVYDIECTKKFSTDKATIFGSKRLLSKEDSVKMVAFLKIKPKLFIELLKPKGSKSKYYITRNEIAHEGKVGITKHTLIHERILPVLHAAIEIQDNFL